MVISCKWGVKVIFWSRRRYSGFPLTMFMQAIYASVVPLHQETTILPSLAVIQTYYPSKLWFWCMLSMKIRLRAGLICTPTFIALSCACTYNSFDLGSFSRFLSQHIDTKSIGIFQKQLQNAVECLYSKEPQHSPQSLCYHLEQLLERPSNFWSKLWILCSMGKFRRTSSTSFILAHPVTTFHQAFVLFRALSRYFNFLHPACNYMFVDTSTYIRSASTNTLTWQEAFK